jgi:hypothetical protein
VIQEDKPVALATTHAPASRA